MRRVTLIMALAAFVAWGAVEAFGSIATTKHNLSVSGPGPIRAQSETQICVFCHTPHNANPSAPLWNHDLSGQTYTAYWSPTLDAYSSPLLAPPPDGASKLCLSCHDGTVALGALGSRTADVAFVGGITTIPPSYSGYVGTDLSGAHPVSFIVTQALIDANNLKDTPLRSLASMTSDANGVRLDGQNKVQCSSCHDPHDDSNRVSSGAPFWRKNAFSDVCSVCHLI